MARATARLQSATVPWETAVSLWEQPPAGNQNSEESLDWQERFAETLFQCLVPQDEFDEAYTARSLRLTVDNALIKLCAAFHAEIKCYYDIISNAEGFWVQEAVKHAPFQGAYGGYCLHALIRSELLTGNSQARVGPGRCFRVDGQRVE